MSRVFLMTTLVWLGATLASTQHAEGQEPSGRLSFHVEGVLFQPKASGSVFDLTTSELGVGSGEYRHLRPSAEVAIRVHRRLSLMAGWTSGSREIESVTPPGDASQSTRLEMENAFTGGVILHLGRWGTEGAWQLDVLGGAGRQSYAFGQIGVFPDAFRPGETLRGAFHTEGNADVQFAGLRLNRTVTRWLGLSVGARYQWSEGEVDGDYVGFAPISLSGIGISTGLRLTP